MYFMGLLLCMQLKWVWWVQCGCDSSSIVFFMCLNYRFGFLLSCWVSWCVFFIWLCLVLQVVRLKQIFFVMFRCCGKCFLSYFRQVDLVVMFCFGLWGLLKLNWWVVCGIICISFWVLVNDIVFGLNLFFWYICEISKCQLNLYFRVYFLVRLLQGEIVLFVFIWYFLWMWMVFDFLKQWLKVMLQNRFW